MKSDPVEILLVEDDPADAELTLHALRQEGFANHVELVRDGAEALDFLFCRGAFRRRTFGDAPRLVLLDLKLPKMSGQQVIQAVKADPRTRAIPIIVLTSSNHERDLTESYQLGVNSYIQKPVDLRKFQETVRQLGLYWLVVNELPPRASGAAGPGESQ